MKKLIFISLLSVLFMNAFCQKFISLSTSPLVPDIGLIYNSNPIFESDIPVCLYSSFEYADYSKTIDVKAFKFAIGPTFVFNNALTNSIGETTKIDVHLGLSINEDTKLNPEDYNEFSIETGFSIEILRRTYFSFLIDLPNNHFKFGIGFGF